MSCTTGATTADGNCLAQRKRPAIHSFLEASRLVVYISLRTLPKVLKNAFLRMKTGNRSGGDKHSQSGGLCYDADAKNVPTDVLKKAEMTSGVYSSKYAMKAAEIALGKTSAG